MGYEWIASNYPDMDLIGSGTYQYTRELYQTGLGNVVKDSYFLII